MPEKTPACAWPPQLERAEMDEDGRPCWRLWSRLDDPPPRLAPHWLGRRVQPDLAPTGARETESRGPRAERHGIHQDRTPRHVSAGQASKRCRGDARKGALRGHRM